ncbi:hypothetical protein DY000_02031962 [Brassica cretica]|uniref:Uncharacterized protein n=1 Tax=Brassica cretica TaxID=69181 RepID=A0ABQ7DMQ5_BRACR|nr:hypothetical protein DY000_02031962 [Brassica cretica]
MLVPSLYRRDLSLSPRTLQPLSTSGTKVWLAFSGGRRLRRGCRDLGVSPCCLRLLRLREWLTSASDLVCSGSDLRCFERRGACGIDKLLVGHVRPPAVSGGELLCVSSWRSGFAGSGKSRFLSGLFVVSPYVLLVGSAWRSPVVVVQFVPPGLCGSALVSYLWSASATSLAPGAPHPSNQNGIGGCGLLRLLLFSNNPSAWVRHLRAVNGSADSLAKGARSRGFSFSHVDSQLPSWMAPEANLLVVT